MQWLRRKFDDTIDTVTGWFSGKPKEPTREQLKSAFQQADAATAQFHNAYGNRATAWAVRYEGRDYVTTSAHATVNYYNGGRGFHMNGKEYFVLVKGDQLALAEHLAFNPQGDPCSRSGGISSKTTVHDMSILRVVPPQETRTLLHAFSFDSDLKSRLQRVLRQNPATAAASADGILTAEELATLTQGFHLKPIPLSDERPRWPERKLTPALYTLGYFENRPRFVTATRLNTEDNNFTFRYQPGNPVIQGFSGGLVFDVSQRGQLVPVGVATRITAPSCTAYAISTDTLREGLQALPNLSTTMHDFRKLCERAVGGTSAWFSPQGQVNQLPIPQALSARRDPGKCVAAR